MLYKLILVLLIIVLYLILKSRNEYFNSDENEAKVNLERPWVYLYDDKGNQLNVILLSRPFFQSNDESDYKNKVKGKLNILGISSYQEFPNKPFNPGDGYNDTTNPYNYNKWIKMCEGWLHCFKTPNDYLPSKMKRILLSESDFIDCQLHKENKNVKKKYDFMYICHRDSSSNCSVDEWVAFNKNLKLAEKCIKILCEKKKLKGLLVGRSGCKLPGCSKKNIRTTKKLDYYELLKTYDKCKIIFIPNIHDASPRVLAEGLSHNLRCLVNEKLVGGWKYVNNQTGEFFKDEHDFEEKIDKILNNYDSYNPRSDFITNYGIEKSGKKLKDFVYGIFGSKVNIPENNVKYLTPEFSKEQWISCEI